MPKAYQVKITVRAAKQLREIFGYIALDSPQNAAEVIRGLRDAIADLATFPHRFAVPRYGATEDVRYRSMPVPPYLVRYRIDEMRAVVTILRIRHGARRPI